jgi:hypothetical protein
MLPPPGADVNACDNEGYTPLGRVLTTYGASGVDLALLSLPDVDLEACGPGGATALGLATKHRRRVFVDVIAAEASGRLRARP